jgi:uncharacterized membrane protein
MSYIYKFIIAVIVLFLVDLLWLTTGGTYAVKVAENIQGSPIRLQWWYVPFVYLFLAYMLLEASTYQKAFIYGVCIYGVYDFTTLGIFKRYDYRFALADTLWGGILFVLSKYFLQKVYSIVK